jgi:DHA2 family multidrug resistance protein-like MFS transporter
VVADGLPLPQRHIAMAVILLGLVLCVMDSTMMNMALPQVARQWQVDPAQTLWVVNANQIASWCCCCRWPRWATAWAIAVSTWGAW